MKPRLVIFDCDGVLVDSEPISDRVFGDMLRELGLELTSEQMVEYFLGYSMDDCMQIVTRLLGHPPPADFLDRVQARALAAYREELKPVPGIKAVLEQLDIPSCVASSGELYKMRITLGVTGLLPHFEDRLFSVSHVARGKPAPDVYLYAADQLKVEPQHCLVIEDSPVGVRAGRAAGMTVFGYCAHTPAERLIAAGAREIFPDMSLLLTLIRNLSNSI